MTTFFINTAVHSMLAIATIVSFVAIIGTAKKDVVAQYKTLEQCIKGMDKNITATKRSVLDPFDWMYSCERED